jgi:uncharacterized protein (TIGR02271 family)
MLDNTTNNPGMQGNLAGQPILEGTSVYDAGGDKVGTVSEHNAQGGYLVVHKGWLFPKDVYVPLNAISRTDADGVYLNMYKDDLKNQNWDTPPAGAGMAGSDTGTYAGSGIGTGAMDTGMNTGMTTPANMVGAQTPNNITGTVPQGDTNIGGHPTPVGQGDVAVPIREEELRATKEHGEAGRVHIHKDVVEEPQNINVPVTREEVRVERVPVEGAASAGNLGADAFQEKDIDVPVMGEQVNVEKQARVGEELHLHKREVTENQRYSDTVRRERVNVDGLDQQGDTPLDNTDTANNMNSLPPNNP